MGRVALVVALAAGPCCCSPAPALAEPVASDTETVVVSAVPDGLSDAVTRIEAKTDALLTLEQQQNDTTDDGSTEQVTSRLDTISEQLGQIVGEVTSPELTASEPLRASAATVTLTAYGNVSPTGTYAQYAVRLLPRVGYAEDYVYFQSSNSDYWLFWGDLSGGDAITGSDLHYARWYYDSASRVTQYQTGTASLSLSPAGYTVLSSLDGWPVLDDGTMQMRSEVGFYALAAVALHCLGSVWSWLLRTRVSVLSE